MSRQRTMEKILSSEYVTIGELVRLTDVRYSTLKYYTEEGMLPFEQSEANLTRRYRREESVKRINHIKALRDQGKTIPEVKELLKKLQDGYEKTPSDDGRFCSYGGGHGTRTRGAVTPYSLSRRAP